MRSYGNQASSYILFKKQLNRETGLKPRFSIAVFYLSLVNENISAGSVHVNLGQKKMLLETLVSIFYSCRGHMAADTCNQRVRDDVTSLTGGIC